MQEGDLLFQPHPAALGHLVRVGHHLGGGGGSGRAVRREKVTIGRTVMTVGSKGRTAQSCLERRKAHNFYFNGEDGGGCCITDGWMDGWVGAGGRSVIKPRLFR